MDIVFADVDEVIHADLRTDEMNRTGWPNLTPNTGFLYSNGPVYSQQRKMVNTPPSSYDDQLYARAGHTYMNELQYVDNTYNMPKALSNEYSQSGRNGYNRKCMCLCTSGVPQCTCGFSRQQEKLKPSLEQNSLQWFGESGLSAQHNQIDTSNPHQSFLVPSSTYGYPFLPDYSDNMGCPQKPVARGASLPNNTPPLLSSPEVKPPLLSTRRQTRKDFSSPHYESNQVGIHSPTHSQFPKPESTSSQCKSGQVNRPNPTTRRKRPRLCHFLLELLANPQQYSSIVEWVDQENGVFKFLNSSEVASQWGKLRDKPNMKYENFARSLRTYIAKGIMTKPRSRLVYRFNNVDAF
ncbi:SAM pointed domain-containing ets transcription factor [Paramuricea clavata]|nr:SAM pointed domain-containing ets transcription factor [Paramuricea clavata]